MNMIEALQYIAREEGKLEIKETLVANMIVELDLTDAQAAKVADVEISFVQQIRQRLEKR